MAFGSAIHNRSSCAHAQSFQSKDQTQVTGGAGVYSAKGDTYPEGTVPTNDVPEIFEEPLL